MTTQLRRRRSPFHCLLCLESDVHRLLLALIVEDLRVIICGRCASRYLGHRQIGGDA